MTYDLIPPTEDFFSYQWYDRLGFGTVMMTDDLYSRIDSTRSKLNKLEAKLGQRLDGDRYNPDLRSFWDKVLWLRHYIGVWATAESWVVQMVYPYSKQVISQWPEDLFGERKEGNILILLSPSTVKWLNAVERRLSDVSSWNVPYSVL